MRIVDHMLIEHRVRIANNERRQLFEVLVCFQIVFIELLCRGREKHRVNLGPSFDFRFNPNMRTVKCLSQNLTHLLILSKERCEAAFAGCTATETLAWLDDNIRQCDELGRQLVVL